MKARVSNVNQRATTGDRKAIFKSVLDNPFKVKWPHVPHNVQNVALASLVSILDGVGTYHLERRLASRKRKHVRHDKEKKEKAAARKKRKVEREGLPAEDNNVDTTPTEDAGCSGIEIDAESDVGLPQAPAVVAHFAIGINEVTKRLELQAQSRRPRTSITASKIEVSLSTSPELERAPLVYVFVCRADIDPQLLVGHLPELVASCNAPIPGCNSPPVHLITLPRQAEHTLAETVGLRRVSVIALDSTTPALDMITSVCADVQPPSASWLTGPAPTPKQHTAAHIPTYIKQLRTTSPLDMRAAKQVRTEERRAAKEKSKVNFQSTARKDDANKAGLSKAQRKAKTKVKTKAKVKGQPSKKRIIAASSSAVIKQDLLPT